MCKLCGKKVNNPVKAILGKITYKKDQTVIYIYCKAHQECKNLTKSKL